jgi:hypothetical protein
MVMAIFLHSSGRDQTGPRLVRHRNQGRPKRRSRRHGCRGTQGTGRSCRHNGPRRSSGSASRRWQRARLGLCALGRLAATVAWNRWWPFTGSVHPARSHRRAGGRSVRTKWRSPRTSPAPTVPSCRAGLGSCGQGNRATPSRPARSGAGPSQGVNGTPGEEVADRALMPLGVTGNFPGVEALQRGDHDLCPRIGDRPERREPVRIVSLDVAGKGPAPDRGLLADQLAERGSDMIGRARSSPTGRQPSSGGEARLVAGVDGGEPPIEHAAEGGDDRTVAGLARVPAPPR